MTSILAPMKFTFATAGSIHFGPGIAQTIPSLIPSPVSKIFLVTGRSPYRHRSVIDLLGKNGYDLELHSISGEPTLKCIQEATRCAKQAEVDMVIGLGGGSVVDAAKAVAALANNEGELIDYLEVVGKGQPLREPALPYMAVPTTAGTGAEVTRNSVIGVPDAGVKVSLRHAYMLPRWAVVDPELTYSLPADVAAYTGMDAFIQCLEAFLCKQANPLTDGLARQGMQRAAQFLRRACSPDLDREAKEQMCVASLCGGLALANAKLGAVHGFAGPLGGMIDAPHGAICASLLLATYRANLEAVGKGSGNLPTQRKLEEVAVILTGNPSAQPKYALAWMEDLLEDLPIQRLGKLGLTSDRLDEAADKAARASSMKGNPVELDHFDLKEILEASL